MTLRVLKKAKDNLTDSIKWCGTLESYLTRLIDNLDNMKNQAYAEAKKTYRTANSNLRMARRCERRVNRYYKRLKGNLDKLSRILQGELQKELKDIRKNARPHEAVLISELSFYTGYFETTFSRLPVELELIKKYGKAPHYLRYLGELSNIAKNLLAYKRVYWGPEVGLIPFMVILDKKLGPFLKKLEGLSG